jgi:glycosyltransferase involved in cell wall biosynthesis
MKLIVQVPCYNEEATLPLVINSIPMKIPGIDTVETMIIDDGSVDRTVEVAKKLGVTHIIKNKQNRGLAATFALGVHESLKRGADIIVNTDGDNQYPQSSIPDLVKPIVDKTHDIVVADRQTDKIAHFSPFKKIMQKFGSRVVNLASGTDIPDAPSGFRAYSRHAAMNLNIITDFSYCMETIISAGRKRIAITHMPVKTNPKTRESRLFKNIFQHMAKSGSAIIRSYTMYRPFKIFLASAIISFLIGVIPYVRFGWMVAERGEPIGGHLQSLIFGAVFIILSVMFVVLGVVADLLAINRRLQEDTLYRMKRLEYDGDLSSANPESVAEV